MVVWEKMVNERKSLLLSLLFGFSCIGIGSFFGLGFLARRGIWRFAWDGDMDIGTGSLELGFCGGLRVEDKG